MRAEASTASLVDHLIKNRFKVASIFFAMPRKRKKDADSGEASVISEEKSTAAGNANEESGDESKQHFDSSSVPTPSCKSCGVTDHQRVTSYKEEKR